MRWRPPPFALDVVIAFFRDTAVGGISAAWLFGSATSGRLHAESDVDVGVLLDWRARPTERDRFEMRLQLAGDLSDVLGNRILVLNDVSPLFARRVVLEGTLLRSNDAASGTCLPPQCPAPGGRPHLDRAVEALERLEPIERFVRIGPGSYPSSLTRGGCGRSPRCHAPAGPQGWSPVRCSVQTSSGTAKSNTRRTNSSPVADVGS